MHIQTPLRPLPATAGSHVHRAVLSQAPRMKRHISSRARIGLRGGERVGISTVSTTVARFFNGNARSSSQVKVLVGHQAASLIVCIRMIFGRMYLLSSTASSFLLRTKTGARTRCVREHPFNPHEQATSETAARGTCVAVRVSGIAREENVSTRVLIGVDASAYICLGYVYIARR